MQVKNSLFRAGPYRVLGSKNASLRAIPLAPFLTTAFFSFAFVGMSFVLIGKAVREFTQPNSTLCCSLP